MAQSSGEKARDNTGAAGNSRIPGVFPRIHGDDCSCKFIYNAVDHA
jgi:hypothetical protein